MDKSKCQTADCAKPVYCRGYCSTCYGRMYRSSDFKLAPPNEKHHRISDVDREAAVGTCSVCGPGTPVHLRPSRNECRTQHRKHMRRHRKAHPPAPVRKPWHVRIRKYGLHAADWHRMLVEQDGRCGVCAQPMTRPVVDHDHQTGDVRGLLCSHCNTAIGLMRDDSTSLRAAVSYLRSTRQD